MDFGRWVLVCTGGACVVPPGLDFGGSRLYPRNRQQKPCTLKPQLFPSTLTVAGIGLTPQNRLNQCMWPKSLRGGDYLPAGFDVAFGDPLGCILCVCRIQHILDSGLVLVLYANLPIHGLFFNASRRSNLFSRLRKYDQNLSIGFKSGDLAGILHKCILAFWCSTRQSLDTKKASLSQSTCHGPSVLTGRRLLIADATFPACKTRIHSALVSYFLAWNTTVAKTSFAQATPERDASIQGGVLCEAILPRQRRL